MTKILKIIGIIWLVLAFSIITLGSVGVLLEKGIWGFLWLFSPFNIANFLMIVLTIAPGGFLLWLSHHFESKKK